MISGAITLGKETRRNTFLSGIRSATQWIVPDCTYFYFSIVISVVFVKEVWIVVSVVSSFDFDGCFGWERSHTLNFVVARDVVVQVHFFHICFW